MKTVNTSPKKRGPVKGPPMADTHIFLPPELLEWAKSQPGGMADLVRRLLMAEQKRARRRFRAAAPSA